MLYDDTKVLKEILKFKNLNPNCLLPSRLMELAFRESDINTIEKAHLNTCRHCKKWIKKLRKIYHPTRETLFFYVNEKLGFMESLRIWWHIKSNRCIECEKNLINLTDNR